MKNTDTMQLFQNKTYQGKWVIAVDDEIHVAATGKKKSQLLEEVLRKYPHSVPTITYIPKTDLLTL